MTLDICSQQRCGANLCIKRLLLTEGFRDLKSAFSLPAPGFDLLNRLAACDGLCPQLFKNNQGGITKARSHRASELVVGALPRSGADSFAVHLYGPAPCR